MYNLMHLTLVRHGETEENLKEVFQDPAGGTLSKKGHEQAKKVGERLKKEEFDIIYCSDAKRTRETVEKIHKHHPSIKVVFTKALREQNVGVFAGKPYAAMVEAKKAHKGSQEHFKVPGGESCVETQKRAIKFLHKILKKKEHRVLVISHGAFLRVLLLHLLGWPPERNYEIKLHNTSVSKFEIDIKTKQAKQHLLNCAKHLD
jgi:broad specificity phosphatase PhoE